ncbi:MAG: class I SAM-dependent methyltransferase [Acidimicrobiia bacterium]|nr:class I SAM-dependent methyltransferase [Acidimicrobiia bacterium]
MAIVDKRDCLTHLQDATLELGCGSRKRHPDAIGIDALDHECVDIVGDVYEVLARVPTASVKSVYSYHLFEHVCDLPKLMSLLERVMQPGGILQVVVPHFSNPYYYSDYTRRHFFGLYSFSYLACDRLHRRKVPAYGREAGFELSQAELIFKASPPFYFRHVFKKMLQAVFNLNRYTRELYEENFCHVFPCYEVRFEMRRHNRAAPR